MEEPIAAEAEAIVRSLLDEWLTPFERECLACYLQRAVSAFGCDGHRFAKRYRDLVAPRATALERRLAASGGHCDCEFLMNAVEPARHLWVPPVPQRPAAIDDEGPDGDELDGLELLEPEPPDVMPRCAGVRLGSTQPCSNWAMLWRPRWLPGRGWY